MERELFAVATAAAALVIAVVPLLAAVLARS
jgi:hypothetical protein